MWLNRPLTRDFTWTADAVQLLEPDPLIFWWPPLFIPFIPVCVCKNKDVNKTKKQIWASFSWTLKFYCCLTLSCILHGLRFFVGFFLLKNYKKYTMCFFLTKVCICKDRGCPVFTWTQCVKSHHSWIYVFFLTLFMCAIILILLWNEDRNVRHVLNYLLVLKTYIFARNGYSVFFKKSAEIWRCHWFFGHDFDWWYHTRTYIFDGLVWQQPSNYQDC